MQGVGGVNYSAFNSSWARAAANAPSDPASASAATGGASGTSSSGTSAGTPTAPSFPALLGGQQVSGGVTATLPDGITIGIWSLAPGSQTLSGQTIAGQDGSSQDGSASAAGGASGGGPDYAYMTQALEQMVEQFMASGVGTQTWGAGASTATAASQAYNAQSGSTATQTSGAVA